MRPCLAGPQVDHQVPLLEKKTIVLARLSSERKLIHDPKIIVIGTHVASSKMGCPPCYALFEGSQSNSIERVLRSKGSWAGVSSHGCSLACFAAPGGCRLAGLHQIVPLLGHSRCKRGWAEDQYHSLALEPTLGFPP